MEYSKDERVASFQASIDLVMAKLLWYEKAPFYLIATVFVIGLCHIQPEEFFGWVKIVLVLAPLTFFIGWFYGLEEGRALDELAAEVTDHAYARTALKEKYRDPMFKRAFGKDRLEQLQERLPFRLEG